MSLDLLLSGCAYQARTHAVAGVRSLQMGLRGDATRRYAEECVLRVTDVTPLFTQV